MAETIFVQPRAEYLVADAGGGYRNALSERHPDHPGGEVNIAGPEVVEVAQTPEVMARLAPRLQDGGTLIRLEGEALKQAQKAQQLRQQQTAVARTGAQAVASGDDKVAAQSEKRVADLEAQVAQLNDRIAALTAPVEGEESGGEQLVAGAAKAK